MNIKNARAISRVKNLLPSAKARTTTTKWNTYTTIDGTTITTELVFNKRKSSMITNVISFLLANTLYSMMSISNTMNDCTLSPMILLFNLHHALHMSFSFRIRHLIWRRNRKREKERWRILIFENDIEAYVTLRTEQIKIILDSIWS